MFEYRRKTIGKSMYFISENRGNYTVKEIYNGTQVAKSKYTHRNINDALSELEAVSREQYYTDPSRQVRF